MSWGRIDDTLHASAKFAELHDPKHPVSVWLHALSWALGEHARKRPGFVPSVIARRYGTDAAVARLVGVGLWHAVEGGFEIHDFASYADRPTKQSDPDDVRRKRAEAGRLGGLARVANVENADVFQANAQANGKQTPKQNQAIASARAIARVPDPDPDLASTKQAPVVPEANPVAEQAPPSGPSDLERSLAEVSRVTMLAGRPDVGTRVRRLVGMAEAQSNGRRPIAPYVAQAVDKLASKLADGETFKPSAALSWVISAADGAWREKRLDAKHAPTEGDELAASYAADWQRARARGAE